MIEYGSGTAHATVNWKKISDGVRLWSNSFSSVVEAERLLDAEGGHGRNGGSAERGNDGGGE